MSYMQKKRGKKGNYALCWEFLKESRNYFWIVALVFLVSALIGYVFPVFFEEVIENFIKELVEKTEGMNFYQLFFYIFQNNLISSLIGIVLGIVFGLFPLISCLTNGYVLGFVARKTADAAGSGVLWRLFPHGVFELPALIISLGLGLRLGMSLFKKDVKKEIVRNLTESLRVFVYIIVPLLILAGLIEAGLMILWG